MTTAAVSRYVTRNPDILGGEPIIVGTRTSVRAIVGLWRLGTPPEEIPTQFPQLTLAQVFDALSFYLDNQAEINNFIERNRIPDDLVHPAVRNVLAVDDRCLLTHNRVDYERLHLDYMQMKKTHSGIIVTPQNSAYEVAKRVGILLNALTADEIFNQLLYA